MTARARIPQVSRSIPPAQVSEAFFRAASPTAATSTTPISPAIEKRRFRMMRPPSDVMCRSGDEVDWTRASATSGAAIAPKPAASSASRQ